MLQIMFSKVKKPDHRVLPLPDHVVVHARWHRVVLLAAAGIATMADLPAQVCRGQTGDNPSTKFQLSGVRKNKYFNVGLQSKSPKLSM